MFSITHFIVLSNVQSSVLTETSLLFWIQRSLGQKNISSTNILASPMYTQSLQLLLEAKAQTWIVHELHAKVLVDEVKSTHQNPNQCQTICRISLCLHYVNACKDSTHSTASSDGKEFMRPRLDDFTPWSLVNQMKVWLESRQFKVFHIRINRLLTSCSDDVDGHWTSLAAS